MTLQSSLGPGDPLWLSEIAAEYGHSLPAYLTQFLGVPDIQTSVSPSDPLWISEFLGKSNSQITFGGTSVGDAATTPSNPQVAFALGSDGNYYTRRYGLDASFVYGGAWLNVPALADQFEVYASASGAGGGSIAGSFDAWLPLTSTQSWSFARSAYGEGVVTISLTFRRAASGAYADTASVDLICNKDA